ncbi:MAG: aminotransferase class IV family protein [Synergistaceae bacterium]|nr:aminotransferase class IV family protein [Synergistaceae bacterium]
MELCYIEGRFVPLREARLPLTDLIIQRGVGVFEVIATHKGRALLLTPHLERLRRSAERSRIRVKLSTEEMKEIIREGVRQAGEDIRVKAYLSGGDEFDEEKGFVEPRFFVIFEEQDLPPKEAYEKGVTLEPLPYGRDDPTVKSVDYRSSYALSQGEDGGRAFEVLYCPDGEITEAGHSTFFLVMDGGRRIVTAPLSRVLKGTTRQVILELAGEEGIAIEERCPLWSELPAASEAFITGSVKKVVPVTRIGGIVIGEGVPGPVTRKLSELYLRRIEEWLE